MNNIITWCNDNQGFLSGILTVFTLLLSTIAIIITMKTSKRQNRVETANIGIALLDRRIEIYDYFLDVLYNINDEMLRITKLYFNYSKREKLDFIFLQEIDFCDYPLYFNNDVCLKSEYVIKMRIAKSIFGNEVEKILNAYINRAIMFANKKVALDKFIDENGIDYLKEKLWFVFEHAEDKSTPSEAKIVDKEAIELLEKMPIISRIAEDYTPFLVCERSFENFIEKYLGIDLS